MCFDTTLENDSNTNDSNTIAYRLAFMDYQENNAAHYTTTSGDTFTNKIENNYFHKIAFSIEDKATLLGNEIAREWLDI